MQPHDEAPMSLAKFSSLLTKTLTFSFEDPALFDRFSGLATGYCNILVAAQEPRKERVRFSYKKAWEWMASEKPDLVARYKRLSIMQGSEVAEEFMRTEWEKAHPVGRPGRPVGRLSYAQLRSIANARALADIIATAYPPTLAKKPTNGTTHAHLV